MTDHGAERAWADAGFTRKSLPPLTAKEAVTAARKLWRHEYGVAIGGKAKSIPEVKRTFRQRQWLTSPAKIELTSGNRYSYPRGGVLYVNPDRGWWHLIHDLSHSIHRLLNPDRRPHDRRQEVLEARMVRYAIAKGWLAGALRPEPQPEQAAAPKPSLQEKRAARAAAALARAEHRLKLAEAAVKRLTPRVRYYGRALGRVIEKC